MNTTGKFKKNKRYRGIVGTTRILADQRRSLNGQVQTNRHRNVSGTSNNGCSNQREHPGRIAKEYGTRPRVNRTDDRITAILARLRGGIAGIYTQKKLNELDKNNNTQDWEEFVKELKMMFSDKFKAADAEWKIETFKQGKRNTADFIIEFEALVMKADTDELHAIFLLKKNVRHDIIKTILEYPPIVMPKTLKEWKVAITSVGQGYESTEGRQDYKTSTGTTYRRRGQPMDIRKSNDNFKDRKLKCFNCNKYRHMAKECQAEKKE